MSPSETECRMASWWSYITRSSSGASPWVWRRIRRRIAQMPDEGQGQRPDADADDHRPLRPPARGQVLGGDTGGDQADDLSAGVAHRRDRAHRRPQGAGVDLGVGFAAQRRFDGADVLSGRSGSGLVWVNRVRSGAMIVMNAMSVPVRTASVTGCRTCVGVPVFRWPSRSRVSRPAPRRSRSPADGRRRRRRVWRRAGPARRRPGPPARSPPACSAKACPASERGQHGHCSPPR